jgi:threonine/homoserine/homoserine lactone efflux protein
MLDPAAALLAGITAGLAVAIPLGPIGVMIVDAGVRNGFRSAFFAGLGTATVDGAYAAAAALFGAAIGVWLAPAAATLQLAAAAVLAAIGIVGLVRLARHGVAPLAAAAVPPAHHTFTRFAALTAVNPLTAATFAALMVGLPAVSDAPGGARLLFVAGAFGASLAWQSTLAGSGAVLGHRLPPAGRWWTTLAGQLIVLGLATRLALG